MRPFKKRRHVLLEKLIARNGDSSCTTSTSNAPTCSPQSQEPEPPNKKQKKAVLWSATVPDNQAGKRTVARKDTPKKGPTCTAKALSKDTCTSTSTPLPDKVHQELIDGYRAIAIKASRLAVDMANCRASQADISLERAKRREQQAKAALQEAASERFLAEQEKEAAAHGTKKAADYLLGLLQRSEAVGANDCATCTGMAGKGLSQVPKTSNNTEPSLVVSPIIPSRTAKAPSVNSTHATRFEKTLAGDANVVSSPQPLKVEPPAPPTVAVAEKHPLIEVVKDKRMICPTTKRMGSYSGQGRANEDTGEFERHGEGCMAIDGSDYIYRGEFVENKRHGHGCELNSKGRGYSGEWRSDMKHGHGSITDEACISGGRFENDQRVGPHAFHFRDGRACLKNHVNNRDLCGPCLAFSACRRHVRVCNDGDVEVVKQGMLSTYLDRMIYHADDGTLLRATVPSPRKC